MSDQYVFGVDLEIREAITGGRIIVRIKETDSRWRLYENLEEVKSEYQRIASEALNELERITHKRAVPFSLVWITNTHESFADITASKLCLSKWVKGRPKADGPEQFKWAVLAGLVGIYRPARIDKGE